MKSRTIPMVFVVGANLTAIALVAATAALSAPAFASGYSPTASYELTPDTHASQRGMRSS